MGTSNVIQINGRQRLATRERMGLKLETARQLLNFLDPNDPAHRIAVGSGLRHEFGDGGIGVFEAWFGTMTREQWAALPERDSEDYIYTMRHATNAARRVAQQAGRLREVIALVDGPAAAGLAAGTYAHASATSPTAAAVAARPPVQDFPYALAGEFVKGPPMSWLIKGVIPKAELGMIYGASGSGKSFFAGDLAVHLAGGLPWRGRRTKRVRVAYIAAEGSVGFKSRLRATAAHLSVKLADLQLGVFDCAPNFTDDAQAAKLKEQLTGLKPDVVFVDTLARVAAGADENSGKDMGKVLDHCKAIQQAAGAMVIIIHHSGKNAALGARGWSGIKAACDVEIEVSRAGTTARVASLSKQKDGADGEDFGFQLTPVVVVGEDGKPIKDEDGEQVWSCYVAPLAGEAIPKPPAERPEPKGPTEEAVQEALIDLLPTTTGGTGVPRKALLEAAAEKLSPSVKLATRKWSAGRSLDSMAKRGVVVAEGGKDGTVRLP